MGTINKLRPQSRDSYLEGLAEEVYNKDRSSNMVRILDALCGGAGVGAARNNLMIKRLQTGVHETYYGDLDELYGRLFDFRRLESESYTFSPKTQLLTVAQMEEIERKDAMYRARIQKHMLAYQYGGTPHGIKLAAESACGYECKVIEAWRYYESLNIAEDSQVSNKPGNYNSANYNEYVVVVNVDSLTEAERYNINKCTKRIRPQDAVMTVVTRSDFMESLVFDSQADTAVASTAYEASSSYWQIKKWVTGRPDWEYDVVNDINLWVSPNEKREAPTQAMVNHQEETLDVTYLINEASASSEHIGQYDTNHQSVFGSLSAEDRAELQKASNAISDQSSRVFTASYYGAEAMVDWSYPLEYTPVIQDAFSEAGRSSRYWSSEEAFADGSSLEWLEVRLKKSMPINRISMNISKKPLEMTPYVLVDPDNDTWVQLTNDEGVKLSYYNSMWTGNTLTGEMATIALRFNVSVAYGFRFEFKRLDTPYYKTLPDGALKRADFPFSIDVSNLSIHYDVMSKELFTPSTYQDIFGNKVETELIENSAELSQDSTTDSYWMSKPNVSRTAVEYIIFDVRENGEPTRIEYMDLDSVYGGCQMNIYSTEANDPLEAVWKPYSTVYELSTARYSLPARKCSFIKLEFTNLSSIPYSIVDEAIETEELEFPYTIKKYFEGLPASTYETELYKQLLSVQDDPVYENTLGVYDSIGLHDIYQEVEKQRETGASIASSLNPLYLPSLVTQESFRFTDNGAISSVLAENMRYEQSAPTSRRTSVEGSYVKMRFYEEGKHEYKKVRKSRKQEIAYVVGLREVSFGVKGVEAGIEIGSELSVLASNSSMFYRNSGFELSQDERMVPATETINSLETFDMYNAIAYKTFEFASNQKPATEQFQNPSDMIEEWSALGGEVEQSEFGVSGTVLKLSGEGDPYGIVSDPKLVRTPAIATVQVDLFTNTASEWNLRCSDLANEEVFNMKYDVEAGRWTTIGTVFTPQPGGMWWSNAYDYRVKIPLKGFVGAGTTVFVPNIDFELLSLRGDLNDFRLVYYNGVEAKEIDCDITDNMEVWFRVQEDIPQGKSADGYYDYELGTFVGAYFFYFGNSGEVRPPMRDYHEVFKPHGGGDCYEMAQADPTGSVVYDQDKGVLIDKNDTFVEIEHDFRIDSGAGFVTFEYTPTVDLVEVPGDTLGIAQARYVIDYLDETKRLSVFTYEKQLIVRLVEGDGFENTFVTDAPFIKDQKSYILIQWGIQGSKPIYKDPETVDEDDKKRRFMDVWVDGNQCECINNVFDERYYDEGVY